MAGEMKAEISGGFLKTLATAIQARHPAFDAAALRSLAETSEWENAELKARIRLVATGLGELLPADYADAIDVLKPVASEYGGLQSLVFPDFVERFGLEHWDVSMGALAWFTRFGSSEFAVRPFIRLDEERMLAQMLAWADSDDTDARRLASEGCRPRLPWATPLKRFIADPAPILPILERLKDDSEEYVRRSVANNLNDISKDHDELALNVGAQWFGRSKARDRLVKHGLRTLLKRGDQRALCLFGYADPKQVSVRVSEIAERVRIGDAAVFGCTVTIRGAEPVKVRLEYAVGFRKANGTNSRKVFQWTEKTLTPGEHAFSRRHSFRQMTTRRHYPGGHSFHVIVNGRELAEGAFDVVPEKG